MHVRIALIARATSSPSCPHNFVCARAAPSRLPPRKQLPFRGRARHFTIRATPSAISTTFTPSSTTASLSADPSQLPDSTQTLHDPTASSPSATFTTLGPSSSLLSISLSASQPIYTRRGTLLSLSGPPHHTSSTLSPLQPLKRAVLGLPFLFQRLTSTSPLSLLITPLSPASSIVVLSLDGRIDWNILRQDALIAWTGSGSSLSISSNISTSTPGLSNLVKQTVTGRGLVALAARGDAYEVKLKDAEEHLAHPSHVVAHTISSAAPTPYRLPHTRFRLSVPSVGEYLPETQFIKAIRQSKTFRFLGRLLFQIRQWLRVVVWGERVFLRFRGPGTIVLQGRAGGLTSGTRDAINEREVNEWADAPAGSVQSAITSSERRAKDEVERVEKKGGVRQQESVTYAAIGKDGKVAWTRD